VNNFDANLAAIEVADNDSRYDDLQLLTVLLR
jgi:hypothetical protein